MVFCLHNTGCNWITEGIKVDCDSKVQNRAAFCTSAISGPSSLFMIQFPTTSAAKQHKALRPERINHNFTLNKMININNVNIWSFVLLHLHQADGVRFQREGKKKLFRPFFKLLGENFVFKFNMTYFGFE